ncbi:MAG: PilZ domain-containing protein [Nitrospiraceae bacterium]|nr:PilZ domain-containing protein [Nitrospiraceae bacterium]
MVSEAEEKREFLRVPFNTEVEIRVGNRTIRSMDRIDISLRGLHMKTDQEIPAAGAPCRVSIMLKASKHPVIIQADGAVVRSVTGSLAVEFTSLDPDSYHHLRQVIINNATDPERAEQEFLSHWGIRRPMP